MASETGIEPDSRRNLEALASQTETLSSKVRASRVGVGRKIICCASSVPSGVGKDATSAGGCVKVNVTSHMVIRPPFVVANRRRSP